MTLHKLKLATIADLELLPRYGGAVGTEDQDEVHGRKHAMPSDLEIAPAPPPGVLAIEASAFGQESYPIEVGYVLPQGQTYCSLIRPLPAWTHWDQNAQGSHHIHLDSLKQHGRDVREVALHLNKQLQGRTMYCDGWADQRAWLTALFDAASLTPNFRLEDLRILLTDREVACWDVLKHQVAHEMRLKRHRASSEAKLLQRTLMLLCEPLPSRS